MVGNFYNKRGTGKVHYVVAGRLRYTPKLRFAKSIYLEPYALYADNPEQKIEFVGDASAKLVTIGCAGEVVVGPVEFGFDGAFNMGRQRVKGWDRNVVKLAADGVTGDILQQYTQVIDSSNSNKPAVFNSTNRKVVNQYSIETAEQNGQILDSSTLQNKRTRFDLIRTKINLLGSYVRFRYFISIIW